MPYDGYSRRSNSYRDLQPVSIISVDPISRTAVAVTRTRHNLTVNTAYATGETITTPAAGDQWYVERFDNEWRLYGRIPFNDATLNIKPEEGQVLVGSATGPLELNGGEVRVNSKVFRLNGVYYRDDGTALQRSTDQVNWTAISSSDMTNLVPVIANALANYEGDDPDEAINALQDWGGLVQTVLDNFAAFWNEICQNVFVSGLKRMGFGDTDLSKIVNGMQNFIDYLFGIIFCDFDGNLTPQTALARLRDLLAPIIDNPFVIGLQQISEILEVSVGNLLNDAVAGVTSLTELIFDIITCNWAKLIPQLSKITQIIGLAGEDSPFGPASIIKELFGTFSFLGDPTNLVGAFLLSLQEFFDTLFGTTGSLLKDAVGGAVKFIQMLFDVIFCQANPAELGAILAALGDTFGPIAIIQAIEGFLNVFRTNPFIVGLGNFLQTIAPQLFTGNLLLDAVQGATKFISTLFDILTCNPAALGALLSVFGTGTPGTGTPQAILATLAGLVTGLLSNPFTAIIQTIAGFLGLGEQPLLNQLLAGSSKLVTQLLKIITTLFPLGTEVWQSLLWFVPAPVWAAVAAEPIDLGFLGGLDPLLIALKPLEDYLGWARGSAASFYANFLNVFGGMGFLTAVDDFDPVAATQYLLQDILGIGSVNEFGEFIVNSTAATLSGLSEWIRDNVLNGITPAQFRANLVSLFGSADPLSATFSLASAATNLLTNITTQLLSWISANVLNNLSPAQFLSNLNAMFGSANPLSSGFVLSTAATNFLTNITTQLSNWIRVNIFNNLDPAIFFSRLQQLFGTGFLSGGTFDPVAAVRALLELFFNPDRVVQANDNGTLSVDVLGDITDFTNTQIIVPLVTTIATGLGIDLTKLGIDPNNPGNINLSTLGDIFGTVLTSLGEVPADILRGLLPPAVVGSVPVSSISNATPNLLTQGAFGDSISVEAADGWSWDNTQNTPGSSGGAAKTTISPAKTRFLYSRQAVPVAKGDRLVVTAKIKTLNLTVNPAGSTPISIAIVPFIGPTAQTPVVIGTQLGSTPSWPSSGSGPNLGQITANTSYEVTNAAWTSVIVRLGVASTATGGTVWWDEINLNKTGLLVQNNVDSLVAAWNAAIGGLNNLGTPATGLDWTSLFAAAQAARGRAETGAVTSGNTITTLANSPQSLISNLFNVKADGTSSIGTMLNYLITTLSGNAYTASDVYTLYFAAQLARQQADLAATRVNGTNTLLFNNPAGGSTIRIEAIPTNAIGAALTTTGSGATLIRTTTSVQSVGGPGARIVPANFFNTNNGKSGDINLLSGNTGFQVTLAGWYMVELAYKLNPVASWGWNFTPVLYVNGAPRKYGTDCMYTWFVTASPGAQRQVQNSFIVFLASGHYVQAGYDVTLGAYVNDNVLGGGTASQTYFSISLLNRSYA